MRGFYLCFLIQCLSKPATVIISFIKKMQKLQDEKSFVDGLNNNVNVLDATELYT